MRFFNNAGKEKADVVIVDIGSSSVAAYLIKTAKEKTGRQQSSIIDSVRQNLTYELGLDIDRFLPTIARAVTESVQQITQKTGIKPAKYVCFIPSALCISQTKIISYAADREFTFTTKLLDEIVNKEVAKFEVARTKADSSFKVIETKVMQVRLNGYEDERPFDKVAKEASIALFVSGSSAAIISTLEQAIHRVTPNTVVDFHSYSFAAANVVRDLLPHDNNFLLLDAAGELTDVMVVVNGILHENLSFPFGLNSLINHTAKSLGSIYHEAEALLRLQAENKLEQKAAERLITAASTAKQDWLKNFHDCLNLIAESNIVPQTIAVMEDGILSRHLSDWLKNYDFQQHTLSNDGFTIKMISSGELFPYVSHENIRDLYALLEVIFFDKILANP